jgi:hypothetical protein
MTYLTRQVTALDATEKGHVGLASYDTERGESPAVWIDSGLVGIDGLSAGDAVTAEQMRARNASVSPFCIEVAKRIAARESAAGQQSDDSVSVADRTQVGTINNWPPSVPVVSFATSKTATARCG